MRIIQTSKKTNLYYFGAEPSAGPLPTFVYFSLSGEDSLTLAPYNTPITELKDHPIRLFSLTIPGHGHGFSDAAALDYWAEQWKLGNDLLTPFFEEAADAITWLIDEKIIDPAHLAFGGLSRGVFIAMHLAARVKAVQTVVGFAPMTKLSTFPMFAGLNVEQFDLHHLVGQIDHLRFIRFYMGNRDTLVGTASGFELMQQMVEHNHDHRLKQMIELFLLPSIGRGGHGTSPEVFASGAKWIAERLGV